MIINRSVIYCLFLLGIFLSSNSIAQNKDLQNEKVPSTSELMSFLGKTLNAQQLEKLIKKYDMKEVAGKSIVFFVRVNAQLFPR